MRQPMPLLFFPRLLPIVHSQHQSAVMTQMARLACGHNKPSARLPDLTNHFRGKIQFRENQPTKKNYQRTNFSEAGRADPLHPSSALISPDAAHQGTLVVPSERIDGQRPPRLCSLAESPKPLRLCPFHRIPS